MVASGMGVAVGVFVGVKVGVGLGVEVGVGVNVDVGVGVAVANRLPMFDTPHEIPASARMLMKSTSLKTPLFFIIFFFSFGSTECYSIETIVTAL